MDSLKYGVGIDIGMDHFDACISIINVQQQVDVKASKRFSNTEKGFSQLYEWANKNCPLHLPVVFLMEATGIYYEQLAWYLHYKDCKLTVVLPNKAKKYKEALGLKSKNDRIDATGLAQMACEQRHTPWKPLSKQIYRLRMLTRQIQAISEQLTVMENQLHALQKGMFRDKEIEKMYGATISLLQNNKKALQVRVEQTIDSDEQLKRKVKNICLIKGLGVQIVAVIIAETNGFAAFESIGQMVSYSGYDVIENTSGTRVGKTKISKKGNPHIRRCLYFPALNVVKYNIAPFKQLFDRVYEKTRIKMKAYTAVQKKLLTIIYVLWKKDEAFDNKHGNNTSNDAEVESSFASAPQEPAAPAPAAINKKVALTNARATQDKHPSKHRRMSSFA
jgi:transposase